MSYKLAQYAYISSNNKPGDSLDVFSEEGRALLSKRQAMFSNLFDLNENFVIKYDNRQEHSFKFVLYKHEHPSQATSKLGVIHVSYKIKFILDEQTRDGGYYTYIDKDEENEYQVYESLVFAFMVQLMEFITDPKTNKDTLKYASRFMPTAYTKNECQKMLESLFLFAVHGIVDEKGTYWVAEFCTAILCYVLNGTTLDDDTILLIKKNISKNYEETEIKKIVDVVIKRQESIKNAGDRLAEKRRLEFNLSEDEDIVLESANMFEDDELNAQEAEDFFQLLLNDGANIIDSLPPQYRDMLELLKLRGNIKGIMAQGKIYSDSDSEPVILKINDQMYRFLANALVESEKGILVRSPFEEDRDNTSLIYDAFDQIKSNKNFVSLFDNDGTVLWNKNKQEEQTLFNREYKSRTNNQNCYLFADKHFADVYQILKTIHPEICFSLIQSIIHEYGLKDSSNETSSERDKRISNMNGGYKKNKLSVFNKVNREKISRLKKDYNTEIQEVDLMNKEINTRYSKYLSDLSDIDQMIRQKDASILTEEYSNSTENTQNDKKRTYGKLDSNLQMSKQRVDVLNTDKDLLCKKIRERENESFNKNIAESIIDICKVYLKGFVIHIYDEYYSYFYKEKIGGSGFTSRLQINFLLFAYRLYLSDSRVKPKMGDGFLFSQFNSCQPLELAQVIPYYSQIETIMFDIINQHQHRPLMCANIENMRIDNIERCFRNKQLTLLNKSKIPKFHVIYETDLYNSPNGIESLIFPEQTLTHKTGFMKTYQDVFYYLECNLNAKNANKMKECMSLLYKCSKGELRDKGTAIYIDSNIEWAILWIKARSNEYNVSITSYLEDIFKVDNKDVYLTKLKSSKSRFEYNDDWLVKLFLTTYPHEVSSRVRDIFEGI